MTRTLSDTLRALAGVSFGAGSGTLNRYETGTWTPRVTFSSASTATYTTQDGRYTIIGDEFIFELIIALSSKGAGSGQSRIDLFPYAAVGSPIFDVQFLNMTTSYIRIGMNMAGTVGTLRGMTAAGVSSFTNTQVAASDFAATTSLYITGSYKI